MSERQIIDEKAALDKDLVPETAKPVTIDEVPETKKQTSAKPSKGKSSYNDGIRMILGGIEPKETRREYNEPDLPVLFKRPNMRSLGFPTPMSFTQNFKDNVDWRKYIANKLDNLEDTNSRVKRSTLDEVQLRNAMIAAILQRQLIMAEDHGRALPPPPAPHHVSSINVPSPLRAPDAFAFAQAHDNHHSVHISTPDHQVSHGAALVGPQVTVRQEVHQIIPTHHIPAPPPPAALLNEVHPSFKGYAPPIKGGSLEDIFGVSSKYFSPKPAYTPEPAYQAPAPAYSPPEPAYKAPVPAYRPPEPRYIVTPEPNYVVTPEPLYHPGPKYTPPEPAYVAPPEPKYVSPEPAYHAPNPVGSYKPPDFHGHPFSMEMVFGLPMHDHYMTKYQHLLPEHMHIVTPDRIYGTPTPAPAYRGPPTPVYREPSPAYQEPSPAYQEPSPAYQEPKIDPAYVAPKKVGYDLPIHGGSLEEVFHVASKYNSPKYDPPPPGPAYAPPAYNPTLLPPHEHNSYTLHYLPYEDYVPVHAEALAVKAKVPSIPGAAHFLVKSPTPHLADFQHIHGLTQRRKRSAEGQSKISRIVKRDVHDDDAESDDYDDYDDADAQVDEAADDRKAFKLPQIKFKKVKLPKLPNVGNVFRPGKNKNKGKGNKGKGKGKRNKNKGKKPQSSNQGYRGQNQSLQAPQSGPQQDSQQYQQQQQQPLKNEISLNQLIVQSTSHGTEVMGTTGNSLPLCTESNRGPGPYQPCLLPGGQRNGPGGIVVRPPPSHPVVQIHVGENNKIPDLAFYPINSPIDKGVETSQGQLSAQISNSQAFLNTFPSSSPLPDYNNPSTSSSVSFPSSQSNINNAQSSFGSSQNNALPEYSSSQPSVSNNGFNTGQFSSQISSNNAFSTHVVGQSISVQSNYGASSTPSSNNVGQSNFGVSTSPISNNVGQSSYGVSSSPTSNNVGQSNFGISSSPSLNNVGQSSYGVSSSSTTNNVGQSNFGISSSPSLNNLGQSNLQSNYNSGSQTFNQNTQNFNQNNNNLQNFNSFQSNNQLSNQNPNTLSDSLPEYNVANSYRLRKHSPDSVPSKLIVFPDNQNEEVNPRTPQKQFPIHPGLVTNQGKTLIEQQQEAVVLQEPRNAFLTNSQVSSSLPEFVQQNAGNGQGSNPFLQNNNNNQNQQLNVASNSAIQDTTSPNIAQQQFQQHQQQFQQQQLLQQQQQQFNQQQQQQFNHQQRLQQSQQLQQQQKLNNQLPSPVTPTQFATTSQPISHPVHNPNNPFLRNNNQNNNFVEQTTRFNPGTDVIKLLL